MKALLIFLAIYLPLVAVGVYGVLRPVRRRHLPWQLSGSQGWNLPAVTSTTANVATDDDQQRPLRPQPTQGDDA